MSIAVVNIFHFDFLKKKKNLFGELILEEFLKSVSCFSVFTTKKRKHVKCVLLFNSLFSFSKLGRDSENWKHAEKCVFSLRIMLTNAHEVLVKEAKRRNYKLKKTLFKLLMCWLHNFQCKNYYICFLNGALVNISVSLMAEL